MVGKDVWYAITKTKQYYNYDPSDMVTHVQYFDLMTLKKQLLQLGRQKTNPMRPRATRGGRERP